MILISSTSQSTTSAVITLLILLVMEEITKVSTKRSIYKRAKLIKQGLMYHGRKISSFRHIASPRQKNCSSTIIYKVE